MMTFLFSDERALMRAFASFDSFRYRRTTLAEASACLRSMVLPSDVAPLAWISDDLAFDLTFAGGV